MNKTQNELELEAFRTATTAAEDETAPLPPALADRWTAAMLAAQGRSPKSAPAPLLVLDGAGDPRSPAVARPRRPNAVKERWRPLLPVSAFFAAAATAAAVLLLIGVYRPDGGPIPAYGLTVVASEELGGHRPSLVTRLTPDAVLQIVLRPEHSVHGDVKIRAFLEEGGVVRGWPVDMQRTDAGVFQLKQPVRSGPGLLPGHRYGLIFVVGQKGEGPSAEAVAEASRRPDATSVEGWQLVRGAIEILPRGGT